MVVIWNEWRVNAGVSGCDREKERERDEIVCEQKMQQRRRILHGISKFYYSTIRCRETTVNVVVAVVVVATTIWENTQTGSDYSQHTHTWHTRAHSAVRCELCEAKRKSNKLITDREISVHTIASNFHIVPFSETIKLGIHFRFIWNYVECCVCVCECATANCRVFIFPLKFFIAFAAIIHHDIDGWCIVTCIFSVTGESVNVSAPG